MARSYTLKKRAERQARTRKRIVEAAVDLHGTLGPARTSISAIAKRARVQRATVYDHFPDEHALFQACTTHFFDRHPPPDPSGWSQIEAPSERLRAALNDTYAYHERVEPMMARVHRDAELLPDLWRTEAAQRHARHWTSAAETILDAWSDRIPTPPLLVAAIDHALAFPTWQALVRRQGLSKRDAVELMVRLARCAPSAGAPGDDVAAETTRRRLD